MEVSPAPKVTVRKDNGYFEILVKILFKKYFCFIIVIPYSKPERDFEVSS